MKAVSIGLLVFGAVMFLYGLLEVLGIFTYLTAVASWLGLLILGIGVILVAVGIFLMIKTPSEKSCLKVGKVYNPYIRKCD